MKRAKLLLNVQFDPGVATWMRGLGYDVVRAWDPGRPPFQADGRILLTIKGAGPMADDVSDFHSGPEMVVDGPLNVDQQMDLLSRVAPIVYVDERGEMFLYEDSDA